MSFSDHKIQTFTHKISDLPDQPNMQPEELKAHFDSSPEELRQALNALCDALAAQTAAADIGFAQTAGVPETTVQEAIENVQSQVTEAIIGSIPSGSITGDKLAQDVRDRLTNIENSVTTEAGTRAGADTNLQNQITVHGTRLTAVETQKCEVYAGIYTGDGAASRTINLGFTPTAVILCQVSGEFSEANIYSGGIAVTGHPATTRRGYPTIQIVAGGFQVFYFSGESSYTNIEGTVYHYIAFC